MGLMLCQSGLKKQGFRQKSQKFEHFGPYDSVHISLSMWSKYVSNNVWRDYRLPVSTFVTVARKIFIGKFTSKIDFPIGHYMLPFLTLADM